MILCEAEEQKKTSWKKNYAASFCLWKWAHAQGRLNYFAVNARFVDSKNELTIAIAVRDTEKPALQGIY